MRLGQRLARVRQPWHSRHALAALPFVLIVAITLADIRAPQTVHLGPLLVVAPAITTSFAGYRLTALVGTLAVGAQALIATVQDGFDENHVAQLIGLAFLSVFAVFVCFLRDRRSEELAQVRSVAEAAQRALLRPLPDRLGALHIASSYLAAAKEARIGGDLYAAARTGGRTRLIIGDVRGKGLAAVGEAATLLGAFREAAHQHATLPALARALDRSVCRHLAEFPERDEEAQEHFITALLIEIPDSSPVIRVINCGHPPPLLIRSGRTTHLTTPDPAPPLGMWDLGPDGHGTYTSSFRPGDTLLLYTDGVVEARDRSRTFYPLERRVAHWNRSSPRALVQRIQQDLYAHADGTLADDAAILAIQRTPPQHTGLHLGDLVHTEGVDSRAREESE
ncbi:PP2C family protein-serine/threonine phosphatase [Streptomyces hygroscopicus]|uniref:PP2C family protein-serine/threonine phosphatase n=1 Tax=Streptomyces hygroscopicus TaxID=1912 RepID=UPI0015814EA9|nr:PP2C family protein-serine/threonine phosphatase [Streptomyces sp. NBRC 109436]